jgi:hypothetical protein
MITRVISAVAHTMTVAVMACSIAFIELTLKMNKITGAYDISSTGQLIPFIIGTTSLMTAVRAVVLQIVQNVNVAFQFHPFRNDY